MTARKREPRAVTIAEIERSFKLASFWFGERWCPAVARTKTGYGIRVIKAESMSGTKVSTTYDYFELDTDGVITIAPWGHTKDWKPGRVVDIAEVADWYQRPDPEAGGFE